MELYFSGLDWQLFSNPQNNLHLKSTSILTHFCQFANPLEIKRFSMFQNGVGWLLENIFHFFYVIVHGLLHRAGLSTREEAQIQPAHVI